MRAARFHRSPTRRVTQTVRVARPRPARGDDRRTAIREQMGAGR